MTEPGRRVASDDFSAFVRQLYRMFKTGSIHLMNNEAVQQQLARSMDALTTLRDEGLGDIDVLFLADTVFVNGTLLKASREVYESALELAEMLDRAGSNQMSISTSATLDDLHGVVEYVSTRLREGGPEERLPAFSDGAVLRRIDPELIEETTSGAMTASDRVGRSYASTLVVMRYLFDNMKRGHYAVSRQLKRLAQQLVLLADRDQDAFLGVTRMRHVQDDEAGRAVIGAVLAILAGRQLTRDVRTLSRLALSAMLADVGRPRAAEMTAETRLAVIPRLTNAQRARMPAATALALAVLGRLHDESLHRTVVGYEAQALGNRGHAPPLYDGAFHPRLESTLVYIVRRFNDLLTFDVQAQKRMSPDQAIATLRRAAADEVELFCVDVLLQALGLLPRGTVVRMASGATGVIVANSDKPGLYGLPTVQLYRGPSGSPMTPTTLDLAHPDAEVLRHGGIAEILDEAPPEDLPQPDLTESPPPRKAVDPDRPSRPRTAPRRPRPVYETPPPRAGDELDDDIVVEFDDVDAPRGATSGSRRVVDPDIEFDVDSALERITGNQTALGYGPPPADPAGIAPPLALPDEHGSQDDTPFDARADAVAQSAGPSEPDAGRAAAADEAPVAPEPDPEPAALDEDPIALGPGTQDSNDSFDRPEAGAAWDHIEDEPDPFGGGLTFDDAEASDPGDDGVLTLNDDDVIALPPPPPRAAPPPPPPEAAPPLPPEPGPTEPADAASDSERSADAQAALDDMLQSFYGSRPAHRPDRSVSVARAEHALAGPGAPASYNAAETGPLPSVEQTAEIVESAASRLLQRYFAESPPQSPVPRRRQESTQVDGLPDAHAILRAYVGADAPPQTDPALPAAPAPGPSEPPHGARTDGDPAVSVAAVSPDDPTEPTSHPPEAAAAVMQAARTEDPVAAMLRAYLGGQADAEERPRPARAASRSSTSGEYHVTKTSPVLADPGSSTEDLLAAYLSGEGLAVGPRPETPFKRPARPAPARPTAPRPAAARPAPRRVPTQAPVTQAIRGGIVERTSGVSTSGEARRLGLRAPSTGSHAVSAPPRTVDPGRADTPAPVHDSQAGRRTPVDAFASADGAGADRWSQPLDPDAPQRWSGPAEGAIGEPQASLAPTPDPGGDSGWADAIEAPQHGLFDREFATSADAHLTDDATPEPTFDSTVTERLISFESDGEPLRPAPGSPATGAEPHPAAPPKAHSTLELSEKRSAELLAQFRNTPDDDAERSDSTSDEELAGRTRIGLPTSGAHAAWPGEDADAANLDTASLDTAEVSAEHAREVLNDYLDSHGGLRLDLPSDDSSDIGPRRRLEPASLDAALTPAPRGVPSHGRQPRRPQDAESTREVAPEAANELLSRYAPQPGGDAREVLSADTPNVPLTKVDADSTREVASEAADSVLARYISGQSGEQEKAGGGAHATTEMSESEADDALARYRRGDD